MNIDNLLEQLREEAKNKQEDVAREHAANILGISAEKLLLLGKFAASMVEDEEMDSFAKVSFFLANIDMVIAREGNKGTRNRLMVLMEIAISNIKK